MKVKSLMIGLVFFSFPPVLFAQSAYTVRSVTIKEAPSAASPSIAQLNKESQVQLMQRRGGWYQVTSNVGNGWIKMLAVRLQQTMNTDKNMGTASYSSNTTLTTGVRGLNDSGMLSGGKGVALQQIDQYVVSVDKASSFAGKGKLVSREVSYVDE